MRQLPGGPEPITPARFTLAEGPLWDGPRGRLLWVDIAAGTVWEGSFEASGFRHGEVLSSGGLVGAVAVADDGRLLVAGTETLFEIGPDDTPMELARILPPCGGRRLNDGKPDPAGRFLIGSLSLAGPSRDEVLVRLDLDGSITVIDEDLTLSNGLAWSTDGRRMYSVDSLTRTIWARTYDPDSGAIGPRSIFAQLPAGHIPDGAATDAEDHLWVAVWGQGEVRRYAPDGTVTASMSIPAPHVSSVAFAGESLDILVVTTAKEDLTDEQLEKYPLSGSLFVADPGVKGAQVALWNAPQPLVGSGLD